jgi:hypothetical protein
MLPLNPQQLAIMAAILGISNAGMDSTFLGRDATVTPEDVGNYYRHEKHITVENAVYTFGQGFFESEAMANMFIEEAKSWVKTLKVLPIDKIRSTYRFGEFLDVIL